MDYGRVHEVADWAGSPVAAGGLAFVIPDNTEIGEHTFHFSQKKKNAAGVRKAAIMLY